MPSSASLPPRSRPTKGSSTSSSSKGRTRPSAIEVRWRRPRLNCDGQVVGAVGQADPVDEAVEVLLGQVHAVEGGDVGEVLSHREVVVEHGLVGQEADERPRLGGAGRRAAHLDAAAAEVEQARRPCAGTSTCPSRCGR